MTDIKPTNDQMVAMNMITEFLANDEKLFALSGAAGTGKTELLGMISEQVSKAIIAAPTNKAVSALRKRGFKKATTVDRVVHKKLYTPTLRPMTEAEIAFYKENDVPLVEFIVEDNYEAINNTEVGLVVVVDEASMTNADDIARLMMLYRKIIPVGDGFQLPPVEGESWYQDYNYDAVLTEPVRAVATSEITQLANMVRNKDRKWSQMAWSKEVTIIPNWTGVTAQEMVCEALCKADLILAHKNTTCDAFNAMVRDLRGLVATDDPTRPVVGDWLLSWAINDRWKIFKSERYKVLGAGPRPGGYNMRLQSEDGLLSLPAINKAALQEQKTNIQVSDCMHFSYGHVITAHKSQGGEWDNVVVIASDKTRNHSDYWNWLYTAVSRAKKHLTVLI